MEKKIEIKKKKQSSPSLILTLSLFQGFFFRETDFYFCQFLFNFFKYSISNCLLSYLYDIFAIYFPDNFFLLKSLSSTIFNFSCCLTSIFILSSNSTTTFFIFSKFFFFFQILYSTINLFYHTKYFTTPCIFLLFKIFSTSHSLTLSISISFISFTLYLSTYSLYCTI